MPHSLRTPTVRCLLLSIILCSTFCQPIQAEENVLAGHSNHGEVFNDGPRQAAYLMPGLPNIKFPVSTQETEAQQFINQGVAQLHGFWFYEAERSFRQAAVLDPDCAMAYWGMAMANQGNRKRGRDFIAQAVERFEDVTAREKLYIEALEQYFKDEQDDKEISKKDRAKEYTIDLEEIVEEYPDDIEARAFLAVQLWQNARADLPIVSHVAINSVLQDIFDKNPNHPSHHYRIHLWDRHKAKRALESAALCGPSSPSIAHMWHMPGHIYDKLDRYHDAAWQQEASARVDHAHMMRDRVMPDQIHNFAHNNEWLIRNLIKIGRVQNGLDLAKNMLELPRHPSNNMLEKRGSSKYGRERLLLVLTSYRLWDQLIDFAHSEYLEPTDTAKLQVDRLRALAMAYALSDHQEEAEGILAQLETRLADSKADEKELGEETKQIEKDEADAKTDGKDGKKAKANRERRKKEVAEEKKKHKSEIQQLEKTIQTVRVALAAGRGEFEEALELWSKSDWKDNLLKAEWLAEAGELEEAQELLEKELKDHPGEILPLAVAAYIEHTHGEASAASKHFAALRELSYAADIETPLLARLAPLAESLELPEDWRGEVKLAEDLGQRPDLDSLGPFRWSPYLAPDFSATNVAGDSLKLRDLKGKPTIVIFYLGFGCLHCIEQLHEFSPRAAQFRETGIDIIAISSENTDSLEEALSGYSKPLDIPLFANPDLSAFKAYRCFDDFEQQPLHGTYLLDPNGRVLWQDISYEPFMDVDFMHAESQRLLRLSGFGNLLAKPAPASQDAAVVVELEAATE